LARNIQILGLELIPAGRTVPYWLWQIRHLRQDRRITTKRVVTEKNIPDACDKNPGVAEGAISE
jgi:hypothetical protein